ncbi:hypothetical protein POX_g08771 [Penicillium oxalicum]|uniref:RecQ-mediated genome instability protein 1 n=1 Tax=Penicillium oxalicum (strain 114-2 / CGMCC 5302) TaxID=933388 RepID=S7ZE21_PENO1|nr:hypothetical protein POX_g08771 [Penicillium oxalicum]EPS26931.1 hypothetical protein PDE_01871 [Penicillium oxalicum 114-2]KAI2786386.1 hypothetical protein POX_g08771 [Penicillium oxalicum]
MANAEQIAAQIMSTKSLCISLTWLNSFLASSPRNVPVSALSKTALFRVLASDIRESLATDATSAFPVDISDPAVQERRLMSSTPVQVLDIEDIGSSLWSQVEAIERVERGEAIRGREIIRTVNVEGAGEERENGSTTSTTTAGNSSNIGSSGYGPHRLILQDVNGTKVAAIEVQRIEGISLEKLPIGAKLLLCNVDVARGMILLDPRSCTILGGKIDSLDKPWREGRKARLLQRIDSMGNNS